MEITLSEPNGDILVTLGGMAGSVINPDHIDGDFAPPPVEATSGPFAVSDFRPEELVIYERIGDDHWNETAARVKVLEVHAYPDTTAGLNALETGMLDVVFGRGVAYEVIDQTLARLDGFHQVGHRANGYRAGLHLRNSIEPFDDIRVRQAIAHAIDRQIIADNVLRDGCEVIHGYYPPGVDGYIEGYEAFPFDPDRARELLAEAGVSDLSFESLVPAEGQAESRAAEAIQAMLKDVGVDMQLLPAALNEVPIRFSEGNDAASAYAGVHTNPTSLATQFFGPNGLAGPEAGELREVIEAALPTGADRPDRIAEAGRAAAESALIIPICAPESPWIAHESVAFVDEMPFTVWGVAMLQNLGVMK